MARSLHRSVATPVAGRPGQVRIIGGVWRSRRLAFPPSDGLRPTPDRVRETLFNWLGQDLSGFRCLDLYAGSGALGFEALSRGAEHVTLVERDGAAARALLQNWSLLNAGGARDAQIVRDDALEFCRHVAGRERFDVIFLDPPFRAGVPPELMALLPGCLSRGGRVFLESGDLQHMAPPWRLEKSGRAGQVHFQLLGWESE